MCLISTFAFFLITLARVYFLEFEVFLVFASFLRLLSRLEARVATRIASLLL